MTLLFAHITHLCLLAFVALTLGALPCGPNVYDLDIVIGTGRVTGSIQTDGTIGVLVDANILAFDLLLDDGLTTLQITLGVNAQRLVGGVAFSASTSSLLFDFSAGGTQFALFQSPFVGSGVRFFCVQTDGCFDNSGAGTAVMVDNNFPGVVIRQTGIIAFATSCLSGGGNGDPHFVGGKGVRFDFNGTANADYVVAALPSFQLNMHLAPDGPEMHFMTELAVLVGAEVLEFDVFWHNATHYENMNKRIAPLGGKVSIEGWTTLIELCSGVSIAVTPLSADNKLRPWLAHDDGSVFYYLDFALTVPHCDDAFEGLLGQTYKCKYIETHESFKFDSATEESFRIKSLKSRAAPFSPSATCKQKRYAVAAQAKAASSSMLAGGSIAK
jgi:hypothetical protein